MTRPSPDQLARSPELASLALLEATLDVTSLALVAAWPELHDVEIARQHAEPRAALDILRLTEELAATVVRYTLVLAAADARQHELPF